MDFLDDEAFAPPSEPRPPRRGPPDRPSGDEGERQIMLRRLMAVGVGIVIVILVVLGVRGCLNARKERAFENYVADLSALTSESNSVSERFFGRLEDPGKLSPLEFETEVKADRSSAEGLLDRATGLDGPDELDEAEELVTLAFQLRRDALAVTADLIATAFAREGSNRATKEIAAQMRTLLAGDVLYARAQTLVDEALAGQEIDASAPASQFLPDSPNWLDVDAVADALAQVSGSEAAAPGVHGLGLIQTTLLPTAALLEEGVPAVVAADGAELEIQVQNQGESEETDVVVGYEIEGGASGAETVNRLAPQETAAVNVPIQPAPSPGEVVTLTVRVEPVPGEKVEDNNEAVYEVTFE